MTIRQCAAFHIRYRPGHFNLIPRGGRLFQQYLVDTEVKAEADGLCYVRDHQDGFNGFRAETICGVRDTLGDGEELDWADDRHVVLPVSVTGSPPVAPPLTGGGGADSGPSGPPNPPTPKFRFLLGFRSLYS